MGGLEEMEHIFQITNFIVNCNECCNLDDCHPIFLKFLTTSTLAAFFNWAIISMRTKNFLIKENIHFLIQNVRGINRYN